MILNFFNVIILKYIKKTNTIPNKKNILKITTIKIVSVLNIK